MRPNVVCYEEDTPPGGRLRVFGPRIALPGRHYPTGPTGRYNQSQDALAVVPQLDGRPENPSAGVAVTVVLRFHGRWSCESDKYTISARYLDLGSFGAGADLPCRGSRRRQT